MEKVIFFDQLSKKDVAIVGGKNSSLGEMTQSLSKKGIKIPAGFATTSEAYYDFIAPVRQDLEKIFKKLDARNIPQLQIAGKKARALVSGLSFSDDFRSQILSAYHKLGKKEQVAVRSSATAEDLPEASFAGQHESFLNIQGDKDLLKAVKECIVSVFNDRVIAYREEKGFNHMEVALSVGIQKMVRSDKGSAGVMFTMDTESGFDGVIVIDSVWGVGEMIVKGLVTPDEFFVSKSALERGYEGIILQDLGRQTKKYIFGEKGLKEVSVPVSKRNDFSITKQDALTLARWGMIIEQHYGCAQDIEWAKDGRDGELYIVQARPETVHSPDKAMHEEYQLKVKEEPLVQGIGVGNRIGQGKARVIPHLSDIAKFKAGEVLVTKMTDPDWVSVMRQASAIVTEEGGRTVHAAIVSRELGIPAVVGAEGVMKKVKTGDQITVDCLSSSVYKGLLPFEIKRYDLKKIPKLPTKIMLNIGSPEQAYASSFMPNEGVGLAREEFIISEKIKIHPLALYHYDKIKDKKLKKRIAEMTVEHKDKKDYFIKELAEGVARIASAFYPKPVIVRLSDFKTNEYRGLVGGDIYEKEESNPMLGFRGACRYLDEQFKPAFIMECQALKRAVEKIGMTNISLMVPFCRTIKEAKEVKKTISQYGPKTPLYVMCEIPSNVVLADEFLDIFDGMSIGSNDLTQLALGLDRENGRISYVGDERNEAIKKMISEVIKKCKKRKKYCGICGQAPSDYPEFATFLMKEGIESISLNPDTVIPTIKRLAEK